MSIINKPLLSVVIPVYNGEKYLNKAIDSILNQTFREFEFIIINDGSTDNSQRIIESYTDNRIIVINKPNTGLIDTLNMGISASTGEWIARMDADDISYPTRFAEQLKFIQDDIAVIGSQACLIDEFDKIYGETRFDCENDKIRKKLRQYKSNIIHPSVIINKSMINRVGGYDPKMEVAEDYDLWLRLSGVGKIINVNKKLIGLRKHTGNISVTKLETSINNGLVSFAYHFRSGSSNIISTTEYCGLYNKVTKIDKSFRKIYQKFENHKVQYNNSIKFKKYLYLILNPNFLMEFFTVKLLKKWVLFRLKYSDFK